MADKFRNRHAKLGYMVRKLFPKVMQLIIKYYVTPQGLQRKYLKKDFHFVITDNEIVLMDKLPNMDQLTIEICYKILRSENMLDEPKCKWGSVPHDIEVDIADDVQRLINATNSILRINSAELTEKYFESLLEEIKLIVTRTDSFLQQNALGSMFNSLSRSEADTVSILQDLTRVKAIADSEFVPDIESEKRKDILDLRWLSSILFQTFEEMLFDQTFLPAILRFEKRPIKFYWGDDFDKCVMNLRSLLKDEQLEGRHTVRVKIIFQNEEEVERNIDVVNSLKDEINKKIYQPQEKHSQKLKHLSDTTFLFVTLRQQLEFKESTIHVMEDLEGKVIRHISLPSDSISNITVHRDRLVCINTTSVYCCLLNGQIMWKFEDDQYNSFRRVTTDNEGNVYVTDFNTNTVVVVSDNDSYKNKNIPDDGYQSVMSIRFCLSENMLDEPKCKWGNFPHVTEIEIADDIQRLIKATNSIIEINSDEVSEHYAEKLLEEIKMFVTRIDSYLEQDTLGSMYNSLCRSENDSISILQELTKVTAIEESLTNTESEKRELYSRLSIPIIETFPNILRDIIKKIMPAKQMYQKTKIKELQHPNSYDSLDVTSIYQLLRQFKLIQSPTKGWGNLPGKVDINVGDDVERIRWLRNKIVHRSNTKVDKKEFNEIFEEFCDIGYRMDQNSLPPTHYEKR
ncbi:unnamed protein product [Mytilus edulis]|uniref:DZIP3-like HEPN domain-containing protein n=1 Tax=Mytilus edulis TaxID=6550 RepID=A0A8S3RRI1_MYTED|nr:unnamed protein product [Mytilus edulis]